MVSVAQTYLLVLFDDGWKFQQIRRGLLLFELIVLEDLLVCEKGVYRQ